jgi:hypothetical protein
MYGQDDGAVIVLTSDWGLGCVAAVCPGAERVVPMAARFSKMERERGRMLFAKET